MEVHIEKLPRNLTPPHMEAPANIFLENPSDLKTQEMNLIPSVAAEYLGLEPWLQAGLLLPRLRIFSPQRKENRACACWQSIGQAPETPCVHD